MEVNTEIGNCVILNIESRIDFGHFALTYIKVISNSSKANPALHQL